MDKQLKKISIILEEWSNVKGHLEILFHERNRQEAKLWMEKGIQLFIQLLLLVNEEAASADGELPLEKLTYLPVNTKERLEFIQARPSLYQSYRQLSELIIEEEKQLARKLARIR